MIDGTSFNSGHKWMNISKAGKDVLGYNNWLDGTFLCGFHALLVSEFLQVLQLPPQCTNLHVKLTADSKNQPKV